MALSTLRLWRSTQHHSFPAPTPDYEKLRMLRLGDNVLASCFMAETYKVLVMTVSQGTDQAQRE
jgi:hypothetical protein